MRGDTNMRGRTCSLCFAQGPALHGTLPLVWCSVLTVFKFSVFEPRPAFSSVLGPAKLVACAAKIIRVKTLCHKIPFWMLFCWLIQAPIWSWSRAHSLELQAVWSHKSMVKTEKTLEASRSDPADWECVTVKGRLLTHIELEPCFTRRAHQAKWQPARVWVS